MTTSSTAPAQAEKRPAAAGAAVEAARTRLDEALLALREIADPAVAVRTAEERLAQALRGCYLAYARRTDFNGYRAAIDGAIEAARGTLAALQEAPTADAAVERALGLVAAGLGSLLSAGTLPTSGPDLPEEPAADAGATAAPVFLPATIGAPALITTRRSVLTPAVALPEQPPLPPPAIPDPPPPPPITDVAGVEALMEKAAADLEAFDNPPPEPPEREAKPETPAAEAEALSVASQIGEPALSESALLFYRARNCFEELAALGNMRRPLGLEPWAAPRTEERLLARVDALVACGDEVLPGLVRELEDRPVPDPEMTWALIFLYGSMAGDDAADQAARVATTADLEAPDMLTFVADALALAPSPALERWLRAWLGADAPPPRRAAALTALARRRRLVFPEAAAFVADADRRVVLAATRALGFCAGAVDVSVLDRLLRHQDPEILRAAFVSALQLRCRLAPERARELTAAGKGADGDAAVFLAISGETDAWEALEAAARQPGAAPAVLDALGWFGCLRAVEPLIAILRGEDKAAHGAAAAALQRLTGAGLTDDGPVVPPPPEGVSLGGPFAPPVRVPELSTKADVWSEWWEPLRRKADPLRRHRFGHLWSVEDDLWELADDQSGAADRQLVHLELCARTGADVPIDLEDFVTRQRERIADLRAHAGRGGARAGDWPTRLLR